MYLILILNKTGLKLISNILLIINYTHNKNLN